MYVATYGTCLVSMRRCLAHTVAMLNEKLYVLCTCNMKCEQGVKIIREGRTELANVSAQNAGARDGGVGSGREGEGRIIVSSYRESGAIFLAVRNVAELVIRLCRVICL